ncbi:MAG TPA: hypothetical protein VGB42_01440 [Candidatus Thermoplasmatota archaeon]
MRPTTVQVSQATRKRLSAYKAHPRQPYDDIINRALDALDEEDLELSDEFKAKLAAGRRDAKAGRVYSTKELLKELGL